MSYLDKILKKNQDRKKDNSFRTLLVKEGLIDFFSNDYLGFARSKELHADIQAKELAADLAICNGSTGSRLLSGNSDLAQSVEKYLANFFNTEAALIFNSGYAANVGVLSALAQKGDTILYDELIHASLKDGARISFADRISFKHNNLEDFEYKIQKAKGDVFVVVESIYSMDGDKARLKEICAIAKKYNACVIVDEAHSTGIYGINGQGLVCEEQLSDQVDIRIHTFGKAMGIHGACVVGSTNVIEYLINFSRSFIYTTAFSPHSFFSIQAAFERVQHSAEIIKTLHASIQNVSTGLSAYQGYIKSSSPIQVLKFEDTETVKRVSASIQSAGFDVRPILSPTVKKGEERLRICVHAYNTETQIQTLLETLRINL
ncbi:8-amino-7-oxononanoate synthase [uncultured Cytophaga sp.]|uniref:aminotransferase class I/II-fold pyridoxal phosphate-dependent enzyme n=1 Tax=uncultured Cytophaga sp. TaxID=160238 RepID=UPI002629D324|nr:8-amino-7-oxononanoate synthase [uncultured Cytophaga sp.]